MNQSHKFVSSWADKIWLYIGIFLFIPLFHFQKCHNTEETFSS
jgi:hypothetical protein